jgi:hypothetical protein
MKRSILVGMLCYSVASFGQDNPQIIIDKFFNLYTTKNSSEAIDYIFSTNKWMGDSKDEIEGVKFKLNSTLKLIGDYSGHDLITKKTIGEHLALYTFLVRYDRQPLRFSMLFYKPKSSWQLQNFSYDDNIDEELKEAAKAFRLKEIINN